MHLIRRHRSLLRIALLALVALGVLMQPVLRSVGDLHDLEHTMALQSDHGHSHHDGHEAPPGEDEAPGNPQGLHGLLHQYGTVGSMALLEPASLLASAPVTGEPPDRTHVPGPPASRLTSPFRPPIA